MGAANLSTFWREKSEENPKCTDILLSHWPSGPRTNKKHFASLTLNPWYGVKVQDLGFLIAVIRGEWCSRLALRRRVLERILGLVFVRCECGCGAHGFVRHFVINVLVRQVTGVHGAENIARCQPVQYKVNNHL